MICLLNIKQGFFDQLCVRVIYNVEKYQYILTVNLQIDVPWNFVRTFCNKNIINLTLLVVFIVKVQKVDTCKVGRYQRSNEKPLSEEGQTTNRGGNNIPQKTKDFATRIQP